MSYLDVDARVRATQDTFPINSSAVSAVRGEQKPKEDCLELLNNCLCIFSVSYIKGLDVYVYAYMCTAFDGIAYVTALITYVKLRWLRSPQGYQSNTRECAKVVRSLHNFFALKWSKYQNRAEVATFILFSRDSQRHALCWYILTI